MLRRSMLASAGVLVLLVLGAFSSVAQGAAPRWWVKEAGAFVPIGDLTGLSEFMSSETLHSLGGLQVTSNSKPLHLKPMSECLVKDRESIEDPPEMLSPGRGAIEEFEMLCEKETGSLNAAAPFPCTVVGEQFEIRAAGLNWQGTLENSKTDPSAHKYYENFPNVSVEVFCPRTKEHAVYFGSLRPQVLIGKLRFAGPESGELVEPTSGQVLSLKGQDFFAPVKYQNVRAK